MQSGVTVALATVWLAGATGVLSVTLYPLYPSLDQYSPQLPPNHHEVSQGHQSHANWNFQDPSTDLLTRKIDQTSNVHQPIESSNSKPPLRPFIHYGSPDRSFGIGLGQKKLDLYFDDRIGVKTESEDSRKVNEKLRKQIFDKKEAAYQKDLFIAQQKKAAFERDDSDDYDSFQDQGPGSIEVYRLDLFEEDSLFGPKSLKENEETTKARSKIEENVLGENKKVENKKERNNKAEKKFKDKKDEAKKGKIKLVKNKKEVHKSKGTNEESEEEIKSKKIIPSLYDLKTRFKTEKEFLSPDPNFSNQLEEDAENKAFGEGGVPELQVGCEGVEESFRYKRDASKFSEDHQDLKNPLHPVNIVDVQLIFESDEDEDPQGVFYEERDELVKLRKLEKEFQNPPPPRGDIPIDLHEEYHKKEKLPVRGDLASTFLNSGSSDSKGDDYFYNGRKLLSISQSSLPKRRKRELGGWDGVMWGFGEDEGIMPDDELQTDEKRKEEEKRRAEAMRRRAEERRREEERRKEEERKRNHHHHRSSEERREEDERIKKERERRLEERKRENKRREERREEDERIKKELESRLEERERENKRREERRRLEEARRQHHDGRNQHNLEEERRRHDEKRRMHEEQRRMSDHRRNWPMDDLRQEEQRRRSDEERRRQEDKRKLDEHRRREDNRRPEELRRPGEERRRPEDERWHEDQKRKHSERRRHEAERRRHEEQRSREEIGRRRVQNENLTPSNLIRPDRRQEEENEKKLQDYIRRNTPIRVGSRSHSENSRRREAEDRRGNQPENLTRSRHHGRDREPVWLELKRAMESTREYEINDLRNPDKRRSHGPSPPSDIGRTNGMDDIRRRPDVRRMEEEVRRLDRERIEREEEEKRKAEKMKMELQGKRLEDEDLRRKSLRYEEERLWHEKIRQQAERMRQEWMHEANRRAQSDRKPDWSRYQPYQSISNEKGYQYPPPPDPNNKGYQPPPDLNNKGYQPPPDLNNKGYQPSPDLNNKGYQPPPDLNNKGYQPSPNLNNKGYQPPPDLNNKGYQPPPDLNNKGYQTPRVNPEFERDRQRLEQERRRLEVEKAVRNRGSDDRYQEQKRREESVRSLEEQRRGQEEERLSALPVSATIIVRPGGSATNSSSPLVFSRGGFGSEIDFPGISPNRRGPQVDRFPAPATRRPPAKGPGPCVWAVVQCCPASNRVVSCFASLGCPGVNWDPNPCSSSLIQAAKNEVAKFYAESNDNSRH